MRKTTLFMIALALAVTPAYAQRAGEIFGGDIGQHYSNDISAKFDQMTVQDIINNPASSIFDAQLTHVRKDRMAKVVTWYDNEWGYACRVADLIEKVAKMDGLL